MKIGQPLQKRKCKNTERGKHIFTHIYIQVQSSEISFLPFFFLSFSETRGNIIYDSAVLGYLLRVKFCPLCLHLQVHNKSQYFVVKRPVGHEVFASAVKNIKINKVSKIIMNEMWINRTS